jgi:hypothetical protein
MLKGREKPTPPAASIQRMAGRKTGALGAEPATAAALREAAPDLTISEEVLALMLDDTDQRLDAITKRTDAIMVRAGLA